MISASLLERVLSKLGLRSRPDVDLGGLNEIYAAYSGHIPNDNVQKRIWLVSETSKPVTGGDPTEFFENWLVDGMGGTCFPTNGALCELLNTLGISARRILGAVMMEGIEHDGIHGIVLVRIGDIDYLAHAQLAVFSVLPLVAGQPASTGEGIHDIKAVPFERGSTCIGIPAPIGRPPWSRAFDLQRRPVDHGTFLTQYALSAEPNMQNPSKSNWQTNLIASKRRQLNCPRHCSRTASSASPGRLTRPLISISGLPRLDCGRLRRAKICLQTGRGEDETVSNDA